MHSINEREVKKSASKKELRKAQKSQGKKSKPPNETENTKNAVTSGGNHRVKSLKTLSSSSCSNNNNNNNNMIITNKNNNNNNNNCSNGKMKELMTDTTSPKILPPGYENAPKFERSNSFSLRGKLSKLLNSITGSKENVSKIDDVDSPYKFTRSRSMILLRRTNRRSFVEPQLEQLSEETEKSVDHPVTKAAEQSDVSFEYVTPQKPPSPNLLVATSTPIEEHPKETTPLAATAPTTIPNPQLNFQKRRSNTIIASFKRTFSSAAGERKKQLNPKWSASLQSLQAIDNMVSYENMSFIDYDKFNGYEKQLERQLSTMNVNEGNLIPATEPTENAEVSLLLQNPQPLITAAEASPSPSAGIVAEAAVVRRKKSHSARRLTDRVRDSCGSFDADFEHNLDKPKNVYRYSLDSKKLERVNDFSRNSFVWDLKYIIDALNLEDGSGIGKRKILMADKASHHSSLPGLKKRRSASDVIDGVANVQLKSKSLTHLDGLNSMIACNHGTGKARVGVSSSEYFSVSFCTENGCQEEEFIPATKGVNLADALSSALRRRNLSFSQITITDNNLPTFLESGSPPFAGSFDENTEVENLAGRHLIITERDGNKKTLQKAASFGSRTRPPRLLSSASTEESTELAEQRNIPGKQLKQRWSGLFGIKNPQQSQLCDLLNSYTKNGVPQRSSSLNFDHPNFDAALEYLDNMHKSWKDFVHCDDMTDNETKIQTAIWELVTTEVYYIHALQTVTDLFLACLEAIQDEKLLTDVDQHRLFSNVRDICEANLKFWTLYLYPMVSNSVATHAPLCIDFFRPGFVTFATTFAPYKKYCAEQSTCQFYCKELNRNNALFTSYLAWCESQKMCNRLRLADILVRPMQRLTKYSLLLAAIRKHIGDLEDVETIDSMIHTVENFVCSVNNHLTTRQENERLKGVMARIESYDVVDTNNEQLDKIIKQYSQMFDLCAPMKGCPTHQVRHLFMEGDHKFKDNLGKADVHCFLLTDMMLVCKSIAKKGLGALKVIRQPYLTDRLVVQHSNNTLNCVYLNEFQVAITAFTLQCSEAKNWYDSLKRAKLIYTRLKQGSNNWESFRYGANTATCGGGGGNADSLGVKKSPMNSSICSHVTSANNSHSGSVEWNDSRNISVDFEKTNSLSSDEGSGVMTTTQGYPTKPKTLATSPHKNHKIIPSSNTLSVEPINHLGQSLPNLNLHHNQTNNTLLVPGTASSSNSGNLLLSPSHRGKSYPPPSPTRATLRRGMAFSASIKNPPLVKTRNITSQNSINWHQIPATPTPTSPHSPTQHQQSPASSSSSCQQIQKQSPSSPTTKAVTPSMPTNSNNSTTTTTTVPTSRSSGNSKNCLNVSNETDV